MVAGAGGPIDVLVYVAGGIRGQKQKPLEDVSVEDFHQIVDANLTGAFLFAQAVAPGMKRAGQGPHRHDLEPRRARAEPDRHPGLCVGQARPARPGAPARA